jgi:GT2 family glycosyltransferase
LRTSAAPRVTLIVTQRERMSASLRSLDTVLADRAEPFRLIYVDGGSPEPARSALQSRAAQEGFTLVRRDEPLWPNAARNIALPHVDTEYVVFMDNDVEVEPGCIAKLVACADQTGAALVGPIYLWSDGVKEPTIHMAGGALSERETPDGPALDERHEKVDAPLAERAGLGRFASDFLEYHCMLARADFLRRTGPLSEEIVCVHEHIDIALAAKAAGLPVVMETAAAVNFLAFEPYCLSDLAYFRWRWRSEAVASSLTAFASKWNLADDQVATAGIRAFAAKRAAEIDPIAPPLRPREPRPPLSPHDVQQSLFGLLSQAHAIGYDAADLELFAKAYNAAATLFVGGFRPCGRPFLMHCVGAASVLVAFGFAPRIVAAALLHSAYSHAPLGPQPFAALSDLSAQIGATFGERIEALVRAYARFSLDPQGWRVAHPLESLTLDSAETVAIATANEIDQLANGETGFAAKLALKESDWAPHVQAVANALGVPALETTWLELLRAAPPAFEMRLPHKESFRLVRGGAAPMAHGAFRAWDEAALQNVGAVAPKRTA